MCGGTPDPIAPGGAFACLIMNVLFFPLGTFVHACLADNYGPSFCTGLLQIVLFVILPPITSLISYIWGLMYAVSIIKSSQQHYQKTQLGGYVSVSHNTQQVVNTTINMVDQAPQFQGFSPQIMGPPGYNNFPTAVPQGYPAQPQGYHAPPQGYPQVFPAQPEGYSMPPQPMGYAPTQVVPGYPQMPQQPPHFQ